VLLSSQLHALSDATCKPHVVARSVRERGAVGGGIIQRSDLIARGEGVVLQRHRLHGEWGCVCSLFSCLFVRFYSCLSGVHFCAVQKY
jgi:hypothetical protein